MNSKQFELPEVDTFWNIYRFCPNPHGLIQKVLIRRAKVHRVVPGGYRLSQLETANYYGLHILDDLDTVKRLQQTERARVIFLDVVAGARFHPYFWDHKHPHHHEKFVQVALVKHKLHEEGTWREIKNDSVSYIIPIVSEGTGESLDELGNGDIEPRPISQPTDAKIKLDTEIDQYIAARVAAKLAKQKRQNEASLFGEVARLSAELAALKSALTAAFPTINIK